MSKTISKESVRRLLKDVKDIMKHPLTDNGIYYIHDDVDMLKGYALIVGPEDTPYFGGNYFFEFHYPVDYPHTPPKVLYRTNGDNIRFNPNLYKCGKVCVSLLNTWRGDQWTSCQSISSVLLTLCTILCENPLLNEPGITSTHVDVICYKNIIEYANVKVSICDLLNKKPGVYFDFFDLFYPYMRERFLENADKLIDFVENKVTSNPEAKLLTTSLYGMIVVPDYKLLHKNLIECKRNLIHANV